MPGQNESTMARRHLEVLVSIVERDRERCRATTRGGEIRLQASNTLGRLVASRRGRAYVNYEVVRVKHQTATLLDSSPTAEAIASLAVPSPDTTSERRCHP